MRWDSHIVIQDYENVRGIGQRHLRHSAESDGQQSALGRLYYLEAGVVHVRDEGQRRIVGLGVPVVGNHVAEVVGVSVQADVLQCLEDVPGGRTFMERRGRAAVRVLSSSRSSIHLIQYFEGADCLYRSYIPTYELTIGKLMTSST